MENTENKNMIQSMAEECKKIQEADENQEEEIKMEETEKVEAPEETEEIKDEVEIKEEEPSVEVANEELMHSILSGVLTDQMNSVEAIKTLFDNAELGESIHEVLTDVREDINKVVGKLQAVLSFENEDSKVAEEAKEEAEEVLEDKPVEETITTEDEVEVISPVEEEEEVKEEETEEVKEESVQTESKTQINEEVEEVKEEEVVEVNDDDEDLQIEIGLKEYRPADGSEDTFYDIVEKIGFDELDDKLTDIFPDGVDEETLDKFFDDESGEAYEKLEIKEEAEEVSDDDDDIEEFKETDIFGDDDIEEAKSRSCHKISIKEDSDFDDDIDEVEDDDDDIRMINKEIRRNKRLADKEIDNIRRRERNADNRLMRKHHDKVDYRRGDMRRNFVNDDISDDEI